MHLVGILHREESPRAHQGHCGNYAPHVGLEQVGAHAGHVAHVIPHVVGNDSRVSGVVFGYTRLHLPHQVRPYVRGLGEDPSAHAGEKSDRAGAKPKSGHRADVLEDQVEYRYAQQAYADYRHAHHRTAGESNSQRRIQAPHGGGGSAHVCANRHIHPNKTGQARADGPCQVGDGRCRHPNVMGEKRIVQNGQDDGYDHHQWQQRQVFPAQKSRRPRSDGVAYFCHTLVACVRSDHAQGHNARKDQSYNPGNQRQGKKQDA